MTDDAEGLYLHRMHTAYVVAQTEYQLTPNDATNRAMVRAYKLWKRAQLDVLGVDCPDCGGEGVVPAGRNPDPTCCTPPEYFYFKCATCRGGGSVLPRVN